MKGVPQERVYQVRAQPRGRPAQVGTSTRISNEVLITAAHVVFDTDSGLPAKDITVESLHGGSRHSARVIWPPRFMDKDLDNGPDVALLQFAHRPNIAKPRGFANLGFGRITGQQAGIQFELIAFPHSRIEDGYRDTLHLDGVINPGSALRRRVFELTPNASYRIQDPLWAGPSDWAGASGAAIFCNGLITAILIEDSPQTPEAPLRAFPVEPLFRSSRFCEVLLQLGISPILKSVELCDLLQTNQDAALRFADEETILPSRLLRPDFEAVSFFGRSDTMQSMRDWCNSAADFDYRLLVGSGGRGKTRLAQRLIQEMQAQGGDSDEAEEQWVCGLLAAPSDRSNEALGRLSHSRAPVLIVIDYAESRLKQTMALLSAARKCSGNRVRILMLARSAGSGSDWWNRVCRGSGVPWKSPMTLPPLYATLIERKEGFEDAMSEFARHLAGHPRLGRDHDWLGLANIASSPPELEEDRFGDALTLQMLALISLLRGAQRTFNVRSVESLEWQILEDHEKKYWDDAFGKNVDTIMQAECVLCASLIQVRSLDRATEALKQLTGQSAGKARKIAIKLRELYPPDDDYYWGKLQPDRLLEHLTAVVLVDSEETVKSLLRDWRSDELESHIHRTLTNEDIPLERRSSLAREDFLVRIELGRGEQPMKPVTLTAAVEEFVRLGGPDVSYRLEGAPSSDFVQVLGAYAVVRRAFSLEAVTEGVEAWAHSANPSDVRAVRRISRRGMDQATLWVLSGRFQMTRESPGKVPRRLQSLVTRLARKLETDPEHPFRSHVDELASMDLPRAIAARLVLNFYAPSVMAAFDLSTEFGGVGRIWDCLRALHGQLGTWQILSSLDSPEITTADLSVDARNNLGLSVHASVVDASYAILSARPSIHDSASTWTRLLGREALDLQALIRQPEAVGGAAMRSFALVSHLVRTAREIPIRIGARSLET